MNLYRLDFKRGELPPRPVRDAIGQEYLSRSYRNACETAKREANEEGWPVYVTRISGGGQMRVVRTVNPTY